MSIALVEVVWDSEPLDRAWSQSRGCWEDEDTGDGDEWAVLSGVAAN